MATHRKPPSAPSATTPLHLLADLRFHLRRFLAFSEEAGAAAGVRAQQYQLLQVIAAAPSSEAASIAYVAERMLLRHNSAVELVDRAEAEGLLTRESDAGDHRRTLLRLTPTGERLLAELIQTHLRGLRAIAPDMMRSLRALAPLLEEAPQAATAPSAKTKRSNA